MLIGTDPESLIAEHKQKALRLVNIIKLIRSGKFRVRMCANVSRHRKFVPREENK